jgi:hypothetical protein
MRLIAYHPSSHHYRYKDKQFSGKGYSLASLSDELLDEDLLKTKMIDIFGEAKLKKDGTPGAVKVLPPIREIQVRLLPPFYPCAVLYYMFCSVSIITCMHACMTWV